MLAYRRVAMLGLLAALGGGAAWLGYEYHHDMQRARARVATGSQVLSSACGPIEFTEAGNGPAVLVIHGAGGGFDQGMELGHAIARRGFRVIAMSRFGYLRTPAPPQPSIALQAAAHACLLDALRIDNAAVVAVSAGAPSALEFALRYPSRCPALVLLAPGWFPEAPSDTGRTGPLTAFMLERALRSEFLFWAVGKFFPTVAYRTVLGTPPAVIAAAGHSEQVRAAALLRNISPISLRQVGLELERELTTAPLSEPLGSMRVPTLAISAKDDLYGTLRNARFIVKHVRGARLVAYPSGGHVFVEHNDQMVETVVAFLRAHG
jgi:pimeloyl-ACP methyl ester carboxylesterase